MAIRAKYDSTCQACNRQLLIGDLINWTKGVKGVTCKGCPMPRSTPANGTPVTATTPTVAQMTEAARADRHTFAVKIGELEAALVTARGHFRAQRDEIAALKARVLELEADRRVGPLAQLPLDAHDDDVVDTDDCPL